MVWMGWRMGNDTVAVEVVVVVDVVVDVVVVVEHYIHKEDVT